MLPDNTFLTDQVTGEWEAIPCRRQRWRSKTIQHCPTAHSSQRTHPAPPPVAPHQRTAGRPAPRDGRGGGRGWEHVSARSWARTKPVEAAVLRNVAAGGGSGGGGGGDLQRRCPVVSPAAAAGRHEQPNPLSFPAAPPIPLASAHNTPPAQPCRSPASVPEARGHHSQPHPQRGRLAAGEGVRHCSGAPALPSTPGLGRQRP